MKSNRTIRSKPTQFHHGQGKTMSIDAANGASDAAVGAAAASSYFWPVIAGAIAVGIGFAIAWPKTAKEGVSRIIATIATSALAGEAFIAWVYAQPAFTFLPHTHKTEVLLTVVAGLPAWWVLAWLYKKYLENMVTHPTIEQPKG